MFSRIVSGKSRSSCATTATRAENSDGAMSRLIMVQAMATRRREPTAQELEAEDSVDTFSGEAAGPQHRLPDAFKRFGGSGAAVLRVLEKATQFIGEPHRAVFAEAKRGFYGQVGINGLRAVAA